MTMTDSGWWVSWREIQRRYGHLFDDPDFWGQIAQSNPQGIDIPWWVKTLPFKSIEDYVKRILGEKFSQFQSGGATEPPSAKPPSTEEPPPTAQKSRDVIEKDASGYYVVATYDTEGNRYITQVLDRITEDGDGGLTSWQQAQEERWKRQDAQQPQEPYEDYRRRLLGELDQPSDWINRWQAQNFPQRQLGMGGEFPEFQDAYKTPFQQGGSYIQQWVTAEQGIMRDLNNELAQAIEVGDVETTETATKEISRRSKALQEGMRRGVTERKQTQELEDLYGKDTLRQMMGGKPIEGQRLPPAPSWLQTFVPSQKTGQPITRGAITQPSAQLWQKTPWSVRQGLSGYADWAGGEPLRDIEERVLGSIPRQRHTPKWASTTQRG